MKKQDFHGSDIETICTHYNINSTDIINFAGNVNPLGPPSNSLKNLSLELGLISQYPDRSYTKLKEQIASYCSTTSENILIGNGSTELISLGIKHVGASKALIISPTYSEYKRELSLLNCSLDEFTLDPFDNFHLDIHKLTSTLENDYNLLILCNPNNPTGHAYNLIQLKEIIDYCYQHNIFVIIDETYIEFTHKIDFFSAIPLCAEYKNLLVLRGFSKFYSAPGMRLGYGITSDMELQETINLFQNPWSVNILADYLGQEMLMDYDFYHTSRTLISNEKERIFKILSCNKNFKIYPSESNFFLLKIQNKSYSSFEIFEKCIEQNLFIRDCNSFFPNGGEFIRFCVLTKEENELLLNILMNL